MLERRHPSALYLAQTAFGSVLGFLIYIFIAVKPTLSSDMFADSPAEDLPILQAVLGTAMTLPILFIFGLGFLSEWIKWKNTWVSAKDNVLIYESGWLSKKVQTIPFSKINTINLHRTLLQRIFGTCRMKIDTGALSGAAGGASEMNLVFSMKEAEQLRAYILGGNSKNEQLLRQAAQAQAAQAQKIPTYLPLKSVSGTSRTVKATIGDFLMYGLTSSGWWISFTIVMFALGFIGAPLINGMQAMVEDSMPQLGTAQSTAFSAAVVMTVLVSFAGIIVMDIIGKLINSLSSLIKYFGFKVTREPDNLVISYGLFSQKSYTMPVRNIHAVVTKQNLLQQLIKHCSVEIVAIGYGTAYESEDKEDAAGANSKALLFPMIRSDRLSQLIEEILPEYSIDVELKKSDKRSRFYHIVRPMICWTILLGAAVALCSAIDGMLLPAAIISVIFLLLLLPGRFLSYKNSSIGWNDEVISVSSGGTRKTTHYIRTDAVQSVHANSGIFLRRRGLANYYIRFHAPVGKSTAAAPYIGKEHLEPLADVVESVM